MRRAIRFALPRFAAAAAAAVHKMSRNIAYSRLDTNTKSNDIGLTQQYNWVSDVTRLVKEFAGTAAIVLVRARAIQEHPNDVFIISVVIASIVSAINFAFPGVAFNPAFVLYAWVEDICEEFAKGVLRWSYVAGKTVIAVFLMAAILAGGVTGAEMAKFIHNNSKAVGQTLPPSGTNAGDVVFNEWWACFLYGVVMLALSARSRERVVGTEAASQKWMLREMARPISEGLCMFVGVVCLYNKTGGSLNLGVSFGAAIVSGDTYMLSWIVLGNFLGFLLPLMFFTCRQLQSITVGEKSA